MTQSANQGDRNQSGYFRTVTLVAESGLFGQAQAEGLSLAVRAITAHRTLTAQDSVILADATSGVITVTLPASSGLSGRLYFIKKTDAGANAVTIDGNASETIDGATTVALSSQYDARLIVCDGSNWHVIASI